MNTQKHNQYFSVAAIIIVLIGGLWLFDQVKNRGGADQESQQVFFSDDIRGLPSASSTETVSLTDGDTYDLVAQQVKKSINGQEVKMLAYNSSIPGPLIKVKQGSEITVNFTNNTDVETTLHSHGVRVDNAFDGIPDVTQDPIPVGGTFTYKLKFPDAGMYWYHPHIREDYAQELGLYGNFLVEPDDPNYWPQVNREVPIVLDDILIENGKIAPFAENDASHTLMGRFGNTMLINGDTEFAVDTQPGEVVRFFFTNTANTRTFNIAIPGAKLKLIGSDGGTYEQENFVDSVVISPSERATVDVLFASDGTYALQHITPLKTYTLGKISVSGDLASPSYTISFNTERQNTLAKADIDPLRSILNKPFDKSLSIGIDMGMMNMMQGHEGHMMLNNIFGYSAFAQMSDPHAGHGQHMMPDGSMMSNGMMMGSGEPIEWEDDMVAMNAFSSKETIRWKFIDGATGQENMDINWKFKLGDKVKIQIANSSTSMHPMQHPIHLHGQRFLVTSTNGVPNDNLVWKDTALVQTGDTVELLVEMTNPGEWMLHCHIAEHLEDGMMLAFTVEE
jgi:FtsP/CotA-like multicopper oxidase with cupredoxin domain